MQREILHLGGKKIMGEILINQLFAGAYLQEGTNSLKAGVGMNVNELKKIIESGEKINVEFKLSENDLTKDVYQSVCSFNN